MDATTRRKPPPEPVVPRTSAERELVRTQRDVSRAAVALARRNALLIELWRAGSTHRHLAALLNTAAQTENDVPVTEDAVQKAIRRAEDWT